MSTEIGSSSFEEFERESELQELLREREEMEERDEAETQARNADPEAGDPEH